MWFTRAKHNFSNTALLLGILLVSSTGLLGASCCAHAAISKIRRPRIRDAYRNPDGMLLIRFQSDKNLFPAGNTLFFGIPQGKRLELRQIEVTWRSPEESTSSPESSLSFSNGSIRLSDSPKNQNALLSCDSSEELALTRLNGTAVSHLQKEIDRGKARLRHLPMIQDPIFLLKVKNKGEYVYITAPRYGFHGNYQVRIGRNGHWKSIPTVKTGDSSTPGLIHFADGGSVYIPAAIHLFSKPSQTRGKPVLIRGPQSRPEELVRPSLNLARIRKLKIAFPEPNFELASPCIQKSQGTKPGVSIASRE